MQVVDSKLHYDDLLWLVSRDSEKSKHQIAMHFLS